MAIEYNWTIANLEYTNDADQGVVVSHWRVTGTDGDHSASAYGTQSFTPDAIDAYVAHMAQQEVDNG